jgi:hypothetical protein
MVFYTHAVYVRLSGTSGLASNPANKEIASSSGASETKTFFFSDFLLFFLIFFKKCFFFLSTNLKNMI